MNCLIEKDGLKLYVLRKNSSMMECIITQEHTIGESLALNACVNLTYENIFEFHTSLDYQFSQYESYISIIKDAIELVKKGK